MAPKGTKRMARPAAAGSAKKAKVTSECNSVAKALLKNAELPEQVKSMLSTASRFALAQYAEARDPHQVTVVGMAADTLQTVQAALQQSVGELTTQASKKEEEKASREASMLEAAKDIQAKKGEAAAKEYAHLEASWESSKANMVLKEALKVQKAGDKAYMEIDAQRQKLDAVKAKVEIMKASACPKKDVQKLEKEAKPFNLDPTLMTQVHLCLTKDPADLSDFEKTMVARLDTDLSAVGETLAAKLATEEPGKATRQAAVDSAQAAATAAKDKLKAAKAALSEARMNVSTAEVALEAAEVKRKSFGGDMAKLDKKLQAAESELQEFMEGPLHDFDYLKGRSAPPPEPEVVDEPEPVPAAAE